MRAAVCRTYGDPEGIEIADLPAPDLGPDQVRVGIQAASVNFPDVLLVSNQYQISVPPPFVPGSEFAGVVLESQVSDVSVGDRVFGTALIGAFAEQIAVPAASLTPVPEGVDLCSAAAFGVAHRTAYNSLRSIARLQAGEELIVLAAGGGVGLATVQLGSQMGASVTAVASSDAKLEAARAHGATRLVNHRSGDLRQALRELLPEGADVVVDPVGGDLSEKALRALRWGGRFVCVGFASGHIPRVPLNLVLLKGVTVLGFEFRGFASHSGEDFRRNEKELIQLLADGRAVPHIGARFDLEQAADALRFVADGLTIGKVVLQVSPGPQR